MSLFIEYICIFTYLDQIWPQKKNDTLGYSGILRDIPVLESWRRITVPSRSRKRSSRPGSHPVIFLKLHTVPDPVPEYFWNLIPSHPGPGIIGLRDPIPVPEHRDPGPGRTVPSRCRALVRTKSSEVGT